MLYQNFQDLKLSRLGFGTMRLPLLPDGSIDEAQVFAQVRCAAEHGVNYYDTAYPYHGGQSEVVIGRALKQLPRESYYLADKYPGHQIASRYDPAEVFEEQLQKCGVDYFDFYLLHNVYENSMATYLDPRWGILDYFLEQKRLGRIRHLGFSSHATPEALEKFLDLCGEHMEFCQIQLNYLDWSLQDARAKYDLLTARGIPVWVMEPLRGGKLANLPEKTAQALRAVRDESPAAWSFRFLQDLPNVAVVLSGMSTLSQMEDNVEIFSEAKPLSDAERTVLLDTAEGTKDSVPCTACRYCCEGCPKGLDIPRLMGFYNDLRFAPNFNIGMLVDSLAADKRPDSCIGCGKCARVCPQKIDIPAAMADCTLRLAALPSWADMCREREEAANRLREARKKAAKA